MKQFLLACFLALSVGLAQQDIAPDNPALKAAQAVLEAGQNEEAAKAFEEILATNYTSYSAHFGLGLALYRLGDFKGARFEFTQLTQLAPGRFEGWYNLGVTLERLGRTAESTKALSTALDVGNKAKLAPEVLRPAYLGLAKALRDQGQYDKAADFLQEAIKKYPSDPDLTYLMAESFYRAGRPLEALPPAYSLLMVENMKVNAVLLVADIYFAQDLPERAVRELDRVLQTVTEPASRAQLLLKKSTLVSGKAKLDMLAEAARLDPRLWQASYNLGIIKLQAGDAKGALEALKAAYASAPEEPKVLLGMASAYDRLGQAAEAGRYASLAASSAQGGDKADALTIQGKSAYTQRKFEDASSALSQAVVIKPTSGSAWLYLGLSQYALADYRGAAGSLEKAMSLEPGSSTAANLGAAYLALKMYPDAERVLTYATTKDSSNAVAWYNLGWALRSLARETEAQRAWRRALELGYAPARSLVR